MNSNRKMLDAKDYVKIVEEWESKSIEQLAEQLQVTQNTIRKAGATMRQIDPSLCAKTKRRTRDDIAKEAIRMLRNQAQ